VHDSAAAVAADLERLRGVMLQHAGNLPGRLCAVLAKQAAHSSIAASVLRVTVETKMHPGHCQAF
jgi:hypothetical protein